MHSYRECNYIKKLRDIISVQKMLETPDYRLIKLCLDEISRVVRYSYSFKNEMNFFSGIGRSSYAYK